jgi:hypothetical protein
MRETVEFHCNDCSGYFLVNLNVGWTGMFLFVCPECGREHPRTITKGVMDSTQYGVRAMKDKKVPVSVTRDTYAEKDERRERIVVMKSAYSKTPRLDCLANRMWISGGASSLFLANVRARSEEERLSFQEKK